MMRRAFLRCGARCFGRTSRPVRGPEPSPRPPTPHRFHSPLPVEPRALPPPQIATYVFPIAALLSGIPVFSIIIRYNLVREGVHPLIANLFAVSMERCQAGPPPHGVEIAM
jgi:hypothetical protein